MLTSDVYAVANLLVKQQRSNCYVITSEKTSSLLPHVTKPHLHIMSEIAYSTLLVNLLQQHRLMLLERKIVDQIGRTTCSI